MKKGFTLIELIAVLVLLSLIAIFTFPSVNKTIKDRKEALYNVQIDNIKASAVSYIDKNGLFKDNDKVIVTLCQLKQSGFTDEKIKNPIDNKYIPDDSLVIVTKDEKDFKKEFFYGTDGYTSCTINDTTLFEYVEIGSMYKDTIDNSLYDDVIIHSGDLSNDDDIVDEVVTSKLVTYFIEYKNSQNYIKKYLYVVDTTGPEIEYKDNVNGSKEIGNDIITIEASQSVFKAYDVIVNDNSGEEINAIVSSNVNLRMPGSYFITYKATDSSGNTTTKTQVVKVVDTEPPVIENINGNPPAKTSMSVVISVDASDTGVGLHPLGAYSFDGGKTWQVSNSITVDNNTILNIVVRDAISNQTKHTEKITNILKDDKNISFTVKSGDLKNNGWFISDVEVLIKPLVSNDYFESFSYCTGNTICEPNINSVNYDGEIIKLSEDSSGTLICGKVNKKDNTSTDTICSTLFKIDKSIPDVSYKFKSGIQNEGYEPWYVSDVELNVNTTSVSGIEKVEYCTTTGNSCIPNITVSGPNVDVVLSTNSKINKVCSIVTNNAGTSGQNTCSVVYQIDKVKPSVSLTVTGGVDNYIGKTADITANVIPSTNESGYTYTWFKNGVQIQSGTSNSITVSNADNIYDKDIYKVIVTTGAGNKGEASKELEVDTIKPTCSLTSIGTSGNDGWFISKSVVVNATFKDSGSGVGSKGTGLDYSYNGEEKYSVTTNTKGTTVYCSVKDKVGNEGINDITIKKDDGTDSSCTLSGENSNWTNSNITIHYYISNKYSSIKNLSSSSASSTVSGNGLGVSVFSNHDGTDAGIMVTAFGSCVNDTISFKSWSTELVSGASVSCPAKSNVSMKYDGVKPTCSINVDGEKGTNGWYISSTTVTLVTDDDGSGVDSYNLGTSATYNNLKELKFEYSGGFTKMNGYVKDKVGNTNTCSYGELKVDTTKPVVSISGIKSGVSISSGTWSNESLTLNCNVNPSSASSGYTYKWTKNGSSYASTQSITASTSGTYKCTVTTGAGNSGEASYVAKIDTVKPTCYSSGENSTWKKGEVQIKYGCNDNDGGSGCKTETVSSIISSTAKTIEKTWTIVDNAGNTITCSKTFNVYVDNTPPKCGTPNTTNDSSNASSSGVTGSISATDADSGIDGDETQNFYYVTGSITKTFKDKAGNSTTCSVNVSTKTMYSRATCKTFNSCADESCEWNTCLSKECVAGYVGRVYGNYYRGCGSRGCSTTYTCYESNPNSDIYQKVGTTKCIVKTGTYDDCATLKCVEGRDTCKASGCGCAEWNDFGSYNLTSCTKSNSVDCKERKYYYVEK